MRRGSAFRVMGTLVATLNFVWIRRTVRLSCQGRKRAITSCREKLRPGPLQPVVLRCSREDVEARRLVLSLAKSAVATFRTVPTIGKAAFGTSGPYFDLLLMGGLRRL